MRKKLGSMALTGLLAVTGLVVFDSPAQAFGRRGGGCHGCNGGGGCHGGGGCYGGGSGCYGGGGCWGGGYGGGCWGGGYASGGCWGGGYATAYGGTMRGGYASGPVYTPTTTVRAEDGSVVPATATTTGEATTSGTIINGVYYPSGAVYSPSGTVVGASYSSPVTYGTTTYYGGYPAYGSNSPGYYGGYPGTFGTGFVSGATGAPAYYGGYSPASYAGYRVGRRYR